MDIKELIEKAVQLLENARYTRAGYMLIAGYGQKASFLLWSLVD